MDEGKTKYCVTLVHGTFAPNARWTQEGSVLRRTLEAALGGEGKVEFVSLKWGGENSQAGRLAGSEKLSEKLLQNYHQHPDAAHFIIAHSHGGNIALMSCAAAPVAKTVKGLICLATPFLKYVPRRYLLNLWLLVFGGFAWFSLVLLLLLSGFSPEAVAANAPPPLTARQAADKAAHDPKLFNGMFIGTYESTVTRFGVSGAMLSLALVCSALIWVSLRQVRKFAEKIRRRQESDANRYPTPHEVAVPVLNVYVARDEALTWLRTLWRVAEFPALLNLLAIVVYGAVGLSGLIWFWPRQLVLDDLNLKSSAFFWIWYGFWGTALFMPIVSLAAAATQILMFSSLFLRGHPGGFGKEGLTTCWWGCVTPQRHPPLPENQCNSRAVERDRIVMDLGRWKAFRTPRHSWLYDSPTAIGEIADWMKKQVAPPVTKI